MAVVLVPGFLVRLCQAFLGFCQGFAGSGGFSKGFWGRFLPLSGTPEKARFLHFPIFAVTWDPANIANLLAYHQWRQAWQLKATGLWFRVWGSDVRVKGLGSGLKLASVLGILKSFVQ
jgi:hypothetical protein